MFGPLRLSYPSSIIAALEKTVIQPLVIPIWEVADPLQKINRLCLGARHREVPAVHEDVRLRKVPKAAVDTVGVGQMQDFQFHGVKLINSRVPDEYLRKCHQRTRLVSRGKGNSFHCHGTLPEG